MINIVWFLFIIIGVIYGIFTGNISNVNEEIVTSAKKSLDVFLGIFPTIVLWLGIMGIVAGMFDLTAAGITSAIIFSFFFALIFKPKN